MPGPFPGMDPFLENHWGDVHTRLTVLAANQLQSQLPRDLRSRIEEHVSVEVEDEPVERFRPDVKVVEPFPRREAGGLAVATESDVAVAEPILVPVESEPPTARSVVVVDRAGGRIVTSIEFLSPHNKLTERARQQFRRKQELLLAGEVNLVEIDLVRQGGWAVAVREPVSRQPYSYPYRVCVLRADRPSQAECYALPLSQRLPKVRIPLRPSDADVVLDVQALVNAAWRDGRYEDLDRSRESLPPFDPADTEWIKARLSAAEGGQGAS